MCSDAYGCTYKYCAICHGNVIRMYGTKCVQGKTGCTTFTAIHPVGLNVMLCNWSYRHTKSLAAHLQGAKNGLPKYTNPDASRNTKSVCHRECNASTRGSTVKNNEKQLITSVWI